MSPKSDNQDLSAKPDVTVDIPHDEKQTPSAPATAPPLPEIEPLPTRPINITDNVLPPPAAPVTPLVSPHEFHERKSRRWPVILMYIILAFVVALLVVLAGRWIYRTATHQTAKTTKPGTSDNNKLPPAAPTGNQQPGSGATNSSASSAPTAGQNQTNGKLPNNGPGNVAAIFVGTAIVVGGLHFLYNLRKQN